MDDKVRQHWLEIVRESREAAERRRADGNVELAERLERNADRIEERLANPPAPSGRDRPASGLEISGKLWQVLANRASWSDDKLPDAYAEILGPLSALAVAGPSASIEEEISAIEIVLDSLSRSVLHPEARGELEWRLLALHEERRWTAARIAYAEDLLAAHGLRWDAERNVAVELPSGGGRPRDLVTVLVGQLWEADRDRDPATPLYGAKLCAQYGEILSPYFPLEQVSADRIEGALRSAHRAAGRDPRHKDR